MLNWDARKPGMVQFDQQYVNNACPHGQVEGMEYKWWLKQVRSMTNTDRWAFECCDVFSQQVMLAAPNVIRGPPGSWRSLRTRRCSWATWATAGASSAFGDYDYKSNGELSRGRQAVVCAPEVEARERDGKDRDGDATSGVRLAATNTARITTAEARPYPALRGPLASLRHPGAAGER